MFQSIPQLIRQSWLVVIVIVLAVLSFYTSHPTYGAQVTPATPDVQTVPKPEAIATPTNTPFPTPTPFSEDSDSGSGGGAVPDNANNETDDTDNNDNSNDNSNDSSNNDNNNTNESSNNSSSSTNDTSITNSETNGTAGTSEAQVAGTGLAGAVTAVTLNVRRGPSLTDPVVDTLFRNDGIEVLGRNSTGSWWYICCGSRAQRAGWVSANFIAPSFAADQANALIPVLSNTGTASSEAATTARQSTSGSTTEQLVVEMRSNPAFAWQGQTLQLQLVVRNQSNQSLTNLQLRDDLPAELGFIDAVVGGQGKLTTSGAAQSGSILTMEWPSIAANAQVTATVTVRIQPQTPAGTMIDNLAVVTSSQGTSALAGITLAMPPLALPRFR